MARASRSRPGKKVAMPLDDHDTVRVGIYMRPSTDDEPQPYSIEAQDERLKSYVGSQPGCVWCCGSPTTRPGPPSIATT